MKAILPLMLLLVSIPKIYTQETWDLAKNKKGIKVLVSKIPASDYYAFKAIMVLNTTEVEIIKILKDVSKYPEWFAYTAATKLINQTSHEQWFFTETDYPWPYSNECMNYHMEFVEIQNGKQKITITKMDDNTNCKYSLNKASGYILLEPDGSNIKITYYFHAEPSQDIPTWLINPRIHEMPYRTFVSLRKRLNQ